MTQVSLTLSPLMMVPFLLCCLLVICFPCVAQENKGETILLKIDTPHLPGVQSKNAFLLLNDSLSIRRWKGQPAAFAGRLNQAKNQIKRDFSTISKISVDSFPGEKKISIPASKLRAKSLPQDSLIYLVDSLSRHLIQSGTASIRGKIASSRENIRSLFQKPGSKKSDTNGQGGDLGLPFKMFSKPLFSFGGGYINYNYNYRSSIDTPFAEKNIGQHNITGSINTMVAKAIPVNVNFWVRRSNSIVYRDITDVQLSFDAAGFRNQLVNGVQQRLLGFTSSVKDSLLEKLTGLKSLELLNADKWLKSPFNVQRIHEFKELLAIDAAHPENRQGDSIARERIDAQIKEAKAFIQVFDSARANYDSLVGTVDSLKEMLTRQRRKLEQYRKIVNGKFNDWASYTKWKDELQKNNPGGLEVPEKYKWLMGIRNFSVGKTPLNYSELSARNIGITGVNFEYNSWYYLAVAGGLIDYRFRDFVVNKVKSAPQYMYMLRAGLGRVQNNYFIFSFFKGQKQLYSLPISSTGSNSIDITGITAEAKWQLNGHTYVIAEAGESVSPDYRSTPRRENGKFTLSGNTNKALSVKFYTAFPQTGGRAEGMYKYTGANYQSFSSFQTNAAVKSWYLKWEQYLFKRKIRITGALRSNEFTNPYIVQNYKSNTIFKSINAVFKMRKWPVISVGYIPMSQLSVVGQQIVENRFQTLTASANHFYRIGNRNAYTMIVFNKFYNTNSDSGFVYFNASNFYLSQNIVFRLFSAGLGVAETKSSQYSLTAAEINLRIPLFGQTVLGMGVKVSNLNQQETKTGGRFAIEMGITQKDRISLNYEKSYLPGTGKQFVSTDMGNIQFSRYF